MMRVMQTSFRNILKYSLLSLFFLLIAGYAWYETKDLVAGPVLEMVSPQNGSSFNRDLVRIKGRAYNISSLSLNGKKIYISNDNEFSEARVLSPGNNIFVMEASDKYGKTAKETLQFYRITN